MLNGLPGPPLPPHMWATNTRPGSGAKVHSSIHQIPTQPLMQAFPLPSAQDPSSEVNEGPACWESPATGDLLWPQSRARPAIVEE